MSFEYTRASYSFFFLHFDDAFATSISDATGRTVDHSDVTVAAKPKARDDEPWLIATRNKKLRFAFAFAPQTEPLPPSSLAGDLMYLFRFGNSRSTTR